MIIIYLTLAGYLFYIKKIFSLMLFEKKIKKYSIKVILFDFVLFFYF